MARGLQITEGLWFAVPLRTAGYGLGLVARANREGVLLGYFFGPRHDDVPGLLVATGLGPAEAVLVQKFGYLGLKQGTWPRLGFLADWDRAAWPMPVFVRYEELTGRSLHVFYDDSDPNKVVREEVIRSGTAEQVPRDGLLGAGAVEKLLTKLLSE